MSKKNTIEKKNLTITIKSILVDIPGARDNDNLLFLEVWRKQYPLLDEYTFGLFSTMFSNGKFISTETIRRIRQRVQFQNPELRGLKYKKRKK